MSHVDVGGCAYASGPTTAAVSRQANVILSRTTAVNMLINGDAYAIGKVGRLGPVTECELLSLPPVIRTAQPCMQAWSRSIYRSRV
jgi:hypothetical protein